MSNKQSPRGRGLLISSILVLFLAALCLLGAIAASLPARTAEIFGPPDLNLSSLKLYQNAITLLLSGDELLTPGAADLGTVRVPVAPGDTLDLILARLVELDLVRHPESFRAYLIYSGIDTRIQAGEYVFTGEMSELELARALADPSPAQTTLSILAGWRAEEVSETLAGIGLELAPEDFLRAVREENKEGYLFPGTYQVDREISAWALLDLTYQRFLSQITPELEAQITEQGLTLHQAVTLASIVEREAVVEEEMPLIAAVFLNRLRTGLNLAADPTIQYALGYNPEQGTWWTNPLSLEDLKLPSSYNTYENPGLPPGPICSPGLTALQAVAAPAETSYLYFRAACDGSGRHLFAETFDQHLGNACP